MVEISDDATRPSRRISATTLPRTGMHRELSIALAVDDAHPARGSDGPAPTHERSVVDAASRGSLSERRAAFARLVRAHWSEAYRVCAAIVGEAAADDAAQDAFLRAFDAMHDDPPRDFRTWLLAIARNRARDLRRARVRYRNAVDTAGAAWTPALPGDAQASPEARAAIRERVRRLRAALADVRNPKQRDAFLMRLNTRLSDDEIGDVLGISAKAVRSYVCQTRKLLAAVAAEAEGPVPTPSPAARRRTAGTEATAGRARRPHSRSKS